MGVCVFGHVEIDKMKRGGGFSAQLEMTGNSLCIFIFTNFCREEGSFFGKIIQPSSAKSKRYKNREKKLIKSDDVV